MNVKVKRLLQLNLIKKISGLCILSYLLTGCSLSVNVEDLAKQSQTLHKVTAKELSAGSQQKVKTSGHYTVQASVNYLQGSLETTTAQGYKVRSTVQSNIFAENR